MGNRTSITDLSGAHNYAYDNIYQLTQATHPAMPTEKFTYDSVGNRISAEGETVGTPVATNYTYDWENRLTKVEYPGMVAQYRYDPFGRRIEKNVNGDIARYVYDGENIVTEYDGNGNVKNAYIHNLGIDDPLSIEQGGQVYFYHKDGLGSVMDLTNSSGSVVRSYRYKSFGEILSETGSLVQPYAFTAREYDPESGLYYYRARYYDPKAGRFLSKDPIGFLGGDVNLYRYVVNNPVNREDPIGLTGQEIELAIKMAAPLIFGAIEVANPSILNAMGYAGDILEIVGGVSGIFLAELIAAGSPSAPVLLPPALALVSAIEFGLAFNRSYQRLSGQPLGADIYDFFHPRNERKPKCP